MFPIAEVAFWKHFLLNFKYGGAHNREVKNWLIPKEKVGEVVKTIEYISEKRNPSINFNAVEYKIPTS